MILSPDDPAAFLRAVRAAAAEAGVEIAVLEAHEAGRAERQVDGGPAAS